MSAASQPELAKERTEPLPGDARAFLKAFRLIFDDDHARNQTHEERAQYLKELGDLAFGRRDASAQPRQDMDCCLHRWRNLVQQRLELVRQSIGQFTHHQAPYVARALTRYVTDAFLTASRWLQRKAWARRAVESGTRPSGTTEGGAR